MSLKLKVGALGTFDSQGSCTNWRGYTQALNDMFEEVQYYDTINLNIRDIQNRLIGHNPDIIFILLTDGLELDIAEIKRQTNAIVVFHYMDYNPDITSVPLYNKPIDIMFLSNKNQIRYYKSEFGLKNINYCPIGCYKYEGRLPVDNGYKGKIVFVGSIDESNDTKQIHYHRSVFYRKLKNIFGTRLVNVNETSYPERNDIYDQLPAIYHSADYALSMDAFINGMDGYTSNRIWAILNFGGLPLVQKWKGIKEHGLVDGDTCIAFDPWDEHEFVNKIIRYDKDEYNRRRIRENAFQLGRKRHTTHNRLSKIMGVLNVKFFNSSLPL